MRIGPVEITTTGTSDCPYAPPIGYLITDRESARNAPPGATVYCTYCSSGPWPDIPAGRQSFRDHECRDLRGRDLGPVKSAAKAGARRAYDSLKKFPIPDCIHCGRTDMKPGEQHTCILKTTPMPHEIAAAKFQARGAAALVADLAEMDKP